MTDQIPGQLSMLDICADKTGYTIGEQYRNEGYTNSRDAMPDHECEVEVIDHNGNRFQATAKMSFGRMVFQGSKGYDICWWREAKQKTCRTCSHWNPYTHGWEPKPVGYACFGFGISKSNSADNPACDTYQERATE